jgi:hypothetical protein
MLVAPLACGAQASRPTHTLATTKSDKTIPMLQSVLEEGECASMLFQAESSQCITKGQASALRTMRAAPICDAAAKLQYWVPCDHPGLAAIQKVLSETEPCGLDEFEQKKGNCAIERVSFQKKGASKKSRGRRILIIDDGMRSLAFARYANRVLDYAESDESGIYHTTKQEVKIPKGVRKIWSDILMKQEIELPQMAFQPTRAEFYKKFEGAVPLGHGVKILNKLADFFPDAEFVIAEPGYLAVESELCSADEDASLEKTQAYVENLSRTLIASIREHDINYINLSSGITTRVLQIQAAQTCKDSTPSLPTLRRIQKIWTEHFYGPLSSIPGVILVQAGVFADRLIDEGDPDYLSDCAKFPNRLRVSSFTALNPNIPPEGANAWHLLDVQDINALSCLDLFINGGVSDPVVDRDAEHLMIAPWFATHTLGTTPVQGFSPSFAAPIALSYIIKLKERMPATTSVQKLLDAATSHGLGKIKDPVRYELHPLNMYADAGE